MCGNNFSPFDIVICKNMAFEVRQKDFLDPIQKNKKPLALYGVRFLQYK